MTDIKVVVLGKMFSGKTALIQRYATNDFSILHAPTIGKNKNMVVIKLLLFKVGRVRM